MFGVTLTMLVILIVLARWQPRTVSNSGAGVAMLSYCRVSVSDVRLRLSNVARCRRAAPIVVWISRVLTLMCNGKAPTKTFSVRLEFVLVLTCLSSMALNIMDLVVDIPSSTKVRVRRTRSVVSILRRCVRVCKCRSNVSLIVICDRLTLWLLFRILRNLKGNAGLLTLLSTLWKNVLRRRLSSLTNVRVRRP